MNITYKYKNNLYINLTNKCTNACTFCIKYKWKGKFRGHDLKLKKEPTAEQVIKAIGNPNKYEEIIFCGYGEPLMKLETLKRVARWIKSKGGFVRINTSGHGNLIHNRNILPDLENIVDAVSISLNSSNSKQYNDLHKPKFGKNTFRKILEFAKQCKKHIHDVTLTFIEFPDMDIIKCRKIAEKIGVDFRTRPYLNEYEEE